MSLSSPTHQLKLIRRTLIAGMIDSPAKCQFNSAIRFSLTEGSSKTDINPRVSHVYRENLMSDGFMREWCWKFKNWVQQEGGQERVCRL
ncbi:hypothetical protein AVEN_193200-1 [Araneus ventricosus]|uniref:Uncharacterized protein n=1 Tax=Araneus ventricosus TaxID=182803 RepID=A0A4Y2B391_ARAVE|nr:hypothetical protein AVEN_193200-1 [Araneus ventricosus]